MLQGESLGQVRTAAENLPDLSRLPALPLLLQPLGHGGRDLQKRRALQRVLAFPLALTIGAEVCLVLVLIGVSGAVRVTAGSECSASWDLRTGTFAGNVELVKTTEMGAGWKGKGVGDGRPRDCCLPLRVPRASDSLDNK